MLDLRPEALDRRDPPVAAGEREMLEAWLDVHRTTFLTKCAGLTAEQLWTRSTPPSSLSLGGLLRHLTEVESNWFRAAFDAPSAPVYGEQDDAFVVEAADPDEDLARYLAEVEHSRRVAAERTDLDVLGTRVRGGHTIAPSLRWVYMHMIEEYARHNGHADLLRERIDGAVGV